THRGRHAARRPRAGLRRAIRRAPSYRPGMVSLPAGGTAILDGPERRGQRANPVQSPECRRHQRSTRPLDAIHDRPGDAGAPIDDIKGQLDPSMQFTIDQGMQALQRSAAGRGRLNAGSTLKDLNTFAQGVASTQYGQAYNRAFQTSLANYQ